MNNHWSKGGVTAHIHEDGTLEIAGQFGSGLGRDLAKDLYTFLKDWYSVPADAGGETTEFDRDYSAGLVNVVTGAADLRPTDVVGDDAQALASFADVLEAAASVLSELDNVPLPEPSEPEKAPENPAPAGETAAPKRRPGRPRKSSSGGDGGTA